MKTKFRTCPDCEASFKLAPGPFPPHKFLGKPCAQSLPKALPLDQHRAHGLACDDCKAGIRLREVKLANGNKATVIEKCDVCLLFETNADAVYATQVLLDMLDVEYASGDDTVADAMDRILDLVKGAAELRENVRQAEAP